jgi:hypothetical protein
MIFDKLHLLFRIRIRIHNLKLRIRIRILQKVSYPYGSGSTTLLASNQKETHEIIIIEQHFLRFVVSSKTIPVVKL